MNLLLVCETTIIEHIFTLVCKRLHVNLTIQKTNSVNDKFDLIIIGAGRASNLAVSAGKAGKRVALIEKSTLGGTCPNRGCVPSKLLLGYAHVANAIKESNRHFIDSSINSIDIKKIFEKTNKTEELLNNDPSGIFPRQTEDTKELYRAKIKKEFAVYNFGEYSTNNKSNKIDFLVI